MIGLKISLGKFDKIETTASIISDQNSMKLEINKRKVEILKYVETKQHPPSSQSTFGLLSYFKQDPS